MGALGIVALLAGTALSAKGEQEQGKAYHDAAIYNARLSTMQANEEADRVRETAKITQGINVTRVAKSGVELSGSALDVIVNNAYQSARQANNAIRAGDAADRLLRMEAKNATKAAGYAMGASVLQGAGSALGGSSFTFAGGAGSSPYYGSGTSGLYRPNFGAVSGAVPLLRR